MIDFLEHDTHWILNLALSFQKIGGIVKSDVDICFSSFPANELNHSSLKR